MDINPLDLSQIIIQLIATTGAVATALIERKTKQRIEEIPEEPPSPDIEKELEELVQKSKRLTILLWAIIAILIVNFGFIIGRILQRDSTTQINITSPTNLANVDQKEVVRGSAINLPQNHNMILVIYNLEVERYYPQDQRITFEADKNWSLLVFIGLEQDIGKKFDIIVLTSNEKASELFDSYFLESNISGDWVGMAQLPEGAMIYDRITVTRK